MTDDAGKGDAEQTPEDTQKPSDPVADAGSTTDPAPDSAADSGVVPPPPPPAAFPPPTAGPVLAEETVPPTRDKAGLGAAFAALGSGLGGAATVIATTRSRHGGDLDWSVYGVAIGVTVVLLALALVAALAARRTTAPAARAGLVTWPGVVGILSVGLLLPVGLADQDLGDGMPYLVGGVIAALSVVGYVIVQRPAFAVTAVLGLGMVYLRGFDDLFGSEVSGDDIAVWIALATTGFVVIITVLGWLLPSRVITSVTVGVVGVVGIAISLVGMLMMRLVASLLQEPGMGMVLGMMSGGSEDSSGPVGGFDLDAFGGLSAVPADYERDVSIVLGLAAALVLIWAIAAVVTDHSGFTILVIAMLATAVPLGTGVLAVQHPTWWIAALGAAGAAVLLIGVVLVRHRSESRVSDA